MPRNATSGVPDDSGARPPHPEQHGPVSCERPAPAAVMPDHLARPILIRPTPRTPPGEAPMRRSFLPLASLLVLAAPLSGQAPPNDVLLPRAAERAKLDEEALGYAEMLRVAGRAADARPALAQSGHDDLLGWP